MNTTRIARVGTSGIVAAAVVLSVAACGDVFTQTSTDGAAVDKPVTAVRFANDSGNVTIRTGDTTSVRREVHYSDEQPGTTHRVDGDVLVLESCPIRNCWIDYEVTVPAGSTVSGSVGSGDVTVTGLAAANISGGSSDVTVRGASGAVNVEVGSGTVTLDDIGGDVAARSGSGDLTVTNARAAVTLEASSGDLDGTGIGGPVKAETGSGTVNLTLTSPQDVQATAQSGDVKVIAPDAAYRLELDTGSGDVETDFTDDAGGEHTIDVTTGSGEIDVERA
jgi:putative adhesin